MLGLSCSIWDLVPWPGIEPGPSALEAQNLNHWTTRKVPYVYFRLGKWCYTKSKFERFSYSSSKWVIKQQIQLATSTTHLTQGLLINVQCSGGSRSFAKKTRASKMRSAVAGHRKLTSMQRQWPTERIVKAHPVITTREVAKDLNVNHSTVQHLRQTGKVRKLNKWVPHELKIKNIIILKVSSSLTLCNNEPFLNQIMICDEKWILCDNQ